MNASGVERRAVETGTEYLMGAQVGISQIAGALASERMRIEIREGLWILIAWLFNQLLKMDSPSIDTDRRTRLEPIHSEPIRMQRIG